MRILSVAARLLALTNVQTGQNMLEQSAEKKKTVTLMTFRFDSRKEYRTLRTQTFKLPFQF